uniref:UDP-glucuronosyltransferase n=1 Tax=Culicoides sonorensis TaxID=179676 RepID=A0A336MNB0_CULSO
MSVNAANIMGIYTHDIKSHYLIAQNLLKELANSGHNNMAKDGSILNLFKNSFSVLEILKQIPRSVILSDEMQTLINTKQEFDAIISGFSESWVFFGLSQTLNAPIILIAPQKLSIMVESFIGVYAHDSFVANPFLRLNDKMNFIERCINTLVNILMRLLIQFAIWNQEDLFAEFFPNSKSNLRQTVRTSVQLVLMNSHFTVNKPLPYMTNMIEVGGLHIPDTLNRLPDPLKRFMDEAATGVIYFCMGSTLKLNDLDLDKKLLIINALKKSSMRIVIKWDDEATLNELTPNSKFYVSNWLPQNEILAHPNVRAYVTHGGILSTTEAIFYGIPIVGMPIFTDQRNNIKTFEDLGIAVQVDYDKLSVESLSDAINRVTGDKKFNETVKELSKRYRDRPMTPVKTAQYWVEYVMRYKKQDFMISPATSLNMVEYFNWDVHLTFLVLFLLGAYFNWKIFKWSVKKMCGCFRKKEKLQTEKIKKT